MFGVLKKAILKLKEYLMKKKKLDFDDYLKPSKKQLECNHNFHVVGYSGNGCFGQNIRMCSKCGLVK